MPDVAADSDEDCIAILRELVSFIPSNNMEDPPHVATKDDVNRVDAALDPSFFLRLTRATGADLTTMMLGKIQVAWIGCDGAGRAG